MGSWLIGITVRGGIGKVIERVQVEADTQGGIIIDRFTDERSIDRKV